MNIVQSTPATEPISVAELKAHCRIDIDDEDDFLAAIIAAARSAIEAATAHLTTPRTVIITFDRFPYTGALPLPLYPNLGDLSISYRGPDGVFQEWPSIAFFPTSGAIIRAGWDTYPATGPGPEAVELSGTFGYEDATAVPVNYKHAIKLLAATYYELRETVITGTIVTKIPSGFDFLLSPLKYRGT